MLNSYMKIKIKIIFFFNKVKNIILKVLFITKLLGIGYFIKLLYKYSFKLYLCFKNETRRNDFDNFHMFELNLPCW